MPAPTRSHETAEPPPRSREEVRTRKGEYVSLVEAGDYLGVSYKTIRRRIADGTIDAVRVGRQIRVRATDLERLRVPVTGS